MPSIPSFRCLFCKHINPVDAVFCSDCGKPLTMQPCPQCGAINDRGASNCDKCGTAISKAARPNHDPGHSPSEPEPLDETLSSEMGETSLLWQKHQAGRVDETMLSEMGARRRMFVAIAASLLVLVSSVLWFRFYGLPVQLAQRQGEKQTVPNLPGAPKLGAATSSLMQAQMNYGLKPTGTLPMPATGTERLENAPSPASPKAVIELILPPLSATDVEVNPRQEPSMVKECPQAVATLGLCN